MGECSAVSRELIIKGNGINGSADIIILIEDLPYRGQNNNLSDGKCRIEISFPPSISSEVEHLVEHIAVKAPVLELKRHIRIRSRGRAADRVSLVLLAKKPSPALRRTGDIKESRLYRLSNGIVGFTQCVFSKFGYSVEEEISPYIYPS